MRLKRGDHVCSIYSTRAELATEVAAFLADGLHKGEQCWYVASGDETHSISNALRTLHVDVERQAERRALKLVSAEDAYIVRGQFDPEVTIKVFNNAIDQAYKDGFTGFRAAAEMSWALSRPDRLHILIEYEALLRTLFASCRAIGLCLYDATRMPLAVINGALATHPLVRSGSEYAANSLYGSTPAARPAES
jgi:hypothetical protein